MSEIIDDKWAAVWPRRWVMVRDAATEEWSGPVQLAFVDSDGDCFCSDIRWYLKGNCRPAIPEEIATVKPAEAPQPQCRIPKDGEIVLSDDEYQELKRLAEIAWAALLSSPTDGKAKWFAEFSWNAAEAMHAESERRRPK